MGTYKEEKYWTSEETNKNVKTFASCLGSFLLSMTGGLILGWWEYEYHATNSQQWMVPFGLILFLTPVIVWFAVVVSGTRSSKEDHSSGTSQLVVSIHGSVDQEKDLKEVNSVMNP